MLAGVVEPLRHRHTVLLGEFAAVENGAIAVDVPGVTVKRKALKVVFSSALGVTALV